MYKSQIDSITSLMQVSLLAQLVSPFCDLRTPHVIVFPVVFLVGPPTFHGFRRRD